MKKFTYFLLIACLTIISGCQTAYYKTMETFGYHKRDILVERVEKSRDAQEEAKEQFQSALEKFSSVVSFEGGELQEKYEQLNAELERSEDKAQKVRNRINEVEEVAEALFKEWEKELNEYSSERLRQSSEEKLGQTKQSYTRLINAMRKAETKMDPVLLAFRDQVLFLKHNLNARAVASLQDELVSIEADIASLVAEMEASIAEANAFIDDMVE